MNACELEIDLFCKGMRLPSDVSLDGVRGISRTRAGLGSGLDVALPTGSRWKREIWVNVPVVEPFVASSPYVLQRSNGSYHIADDRSGAKYPVRLPREPQWYSKLTSRDIPMSRIGVLQGTYLGICVSPVCAFWNHDPPLNCRFCTTGRTVGAVDAEDKAVADVVETCWAAKEESGITFVHLHGGFQGSRGIAITEPYVRAIKEEVGLLVGVQIAPERDVTGYDRLIELGVDHLSFRLEFFDPEWFARICPGKDRMMGQRLFLDAINYCAARMPHGAVSGAVIAGVEPLDKTLEAIDGIAALGALPTVCIFRPVVGSDMEAWPSPSSEDMTLVMRHLYEACRRHWLPIGAAPNIEVSLVVNPDDTALLAERTAGFYVYEAWRRLFKVAARPIFARRMRVRRGPSVALSVRH